MKVLLFSNLYPSQREPTRGIFNMHRFGALARVCETQVVVPLPWWSRIARPEEWLKAPRDNTTGIEATFPTYWSLPRLSKLHGRGMYYSLRSHVKRLRREFPFDVILAAWAYPDGCAAARLARSVNCPLVTMVLGSDVNAYTADPALRKQIQQGLGQAQRIVTVSHALRDRVVDLGIDPQRVIVQHNGVNGERFHIRRREDVRAQLGLPLDRRIVCYVGNFKPEKGVSVLVEAMNFLRKNETSDVMVAMVGDGELEAQLRARVAELKLEAQVRFCGRRPHTEIPDWISAGDVLCLPSYREGCPNVVLEALASGRPVVASDVGGVPELLKPGTGVLVPPGDPHALAAGLQQALCRSWNPTALRASVECLSWDQFGLALKNTLGSAIEEWKG